MLEGAIVMILTPTHTIRGERQPKLVLQEAKILEVRSGVKAKMCAGPLPYKMKITILIRVVKIKIKGLGRRNEGHLCRK